jgi:DNA replication initiation complex subunit (GINS family)
MDFAEMIQEERQRLATRLEELAVQKAHIEQEERAVKIELDGINAYLNAKMGKVIKDQAERKKRGPRQGDSVKSTVLTLLTEAGAPISKQDLITRMKAEDNKSLQNGISNALVVLKKDGAIASPQRGVYSLATVPTEPAKPKVRRVPKEEATT